MILDLSYTMLKAFFNCEYSFFLRYVERVPLAENSASVFGTAIHRSISIGHVNNLTNKEDWIKLFKREWFAETSNKKIIYSSDRDYIKKLEDGRKMMADYFDTYVKGNKPPQNIEMRFGKKENIRLGNHLLVGIIDQIDEDKIVDLKTGSRPNSKLELDLDLQFTIYSYAYKQLFGKEEKGLILRHLGTMKDMTTERTEKDFEILLSEVNKIQAKVDSGVFTRNLDRSCAKCYFLESCLGKERKYERWGR